MAQQRLAIGSAVQWTHISQRGRSISMRLRDGILIALDGDTARVRLPSDKEIALKAARLRPTNHPTQIDEFVAIVREASWPNND